MTTGMLPPFTRLALLLFGLLHGAGAAAAEWVYTVQPGDNPWNLTAKYLAGVKYWPRIQTLNQIADPLHIPPGTRLRIPVAWLRRAEAVAEVLAVRGEVTVSGRRASRAATAGMRLGSGDVLRTASAANATLAFGDGSRVLVHAEAELHLDRLGHFENTDYHETTLRLVRGRMENLVTPLGSGPGRFEISTPAAVTAVRGTRYRVNAGADDTRAEVLEGGVGVAGASGAVEVGAGYGTLAAASAAPLAPVELLPPPVLDTLPAVLERVPVSFTLPLQAAAEDWRYQLTAAATREPLLYDGRANGGVLRAGDVPDGDYVLRVRGVDARGLEGRDGDHAFTLNARPEPPLLTAPAPSAPVPDERPVMSWGASTSVSGYRLQVARDATFTDLLMDDVTLTAATATLPTALPLGTYFWRVAAIDAQEGQGPFSDTQEFRRVVPAPALEAPAVDGDEMSVRWRAGEPGESFQFQLAGDEQFGTPVVDVHVSEALATFALPEQGGTYFMRVKPIAADGFEGVYGRAQQIEVPGRGGRPWWVLLLLPLVVLAL